MWNQYEIRLSAFHPFLKVIFTLPLNFLPHPPFFFLSVFHEPPTWNHQKCLFKCCSESLGKRKSDQRKFLPQYPLKLTKKKKKCYFSKGQEFIGSSQKLKKDKTSCNKVWELALNVAYHTCSPERELRKGESATPWYPEYTLIWREVARRVSGWGDGEPGVVCATADPTEAGGVAGQLCSKAAAEWEEQLEPMEQEMPALAAKTDLVKDVRWDSEERTWSRVPARTAGSSGGALLPTPKSQATAQ